MNLDIELLNVLVGGIIPLLVGLVTKEVASSGLKGILNALLSAVSGILLVAVENDGALIVDQAVNSGVVTFLISISSYYGIHKPTGLSDRVSGKTAEFGVGKATASHSAS